MATVVTRTVDGPGAGEGPDGGVELTVDSCVEDAWRVVVLVVVVKVVVVVAPMSTTLSHFAHVLQMFQPHLMNQGWPLVAQRDLHSPCSSVVVDAPEVVVLVVVEVSVVVVQIAAPALPRSSMPEKRDAKSGQ